jgi:hypothetical protein
VSSFSERFLRAALDAIPDYQIQLDRVQYRAMQGVHSVKSMPVTFTPTSAGALTSS